ncbi:MAG: penicillin-binding protein 2 [Candidatus Midichloria sp.]|nr:MAG: penicillin-binding protein 2 [Candidatus Midichloria sp.]
MRSQREKNKIFTRRAFLLGVGKLTLFSALASRFSYLQIISNSKYRAMAENNSIKIVIIPPLRGLLLDRNGMIIADNQFYYSLVLLSPFKKEAEKIIQNLNKILEYETNISRLGVKRALRAAGKNNQIMIQDNLSWLDIAKIEVRTDLYGVEIIRSHKRRYVFSNMISHVTGYISKPSIEEAERSSVPHYQEFLIGKNGVERSLNSLLLGSPGARKIEVNAAGKFMRELIYNPPSRGITIKLSIDTNLQRIVATNLVSLHGSVVVMNANNGEILAMHSTPSYDPNKFVGGVQLDYWNQLKINYGKPLINKSISNYYPPGSIFKIVTALAILKTGIDPARKILCTGEHQVRNRIFRCNRKEGHGWVDLHNAIAKSCNVYFYTLGLAAGIDTIIETAIKLGFNQKTNIELPFENPGLLPTSDWIGKKLKNRWGAGDTINATIGQGYILITPIQLATALAKIATGLKVVPTILAASRNFSTELLDLPENHLQLVRAGLHDVFNNSEGTGYRRRFADKKYTLSGKTGTAQVVSQAKRNQILQYKMRDHSLFAGYISTNDKKLYAISVVAEHSGWGSASALPIATNIMREYLSMTNTQIEEDVDDNLIRDD